MRVPSRRSAGRRPRVTLALALAAAIGIGCDRGTAAPTPPPDAAASPKGAAPLPPPPSSPLVQQGHVAYAKYCATCHGEFASGYVADNAPSLRSPTFLSTASDDFLRAGITRGRPGTAMA